MSGRTTIQKTSERELPFIAGDGRRGTLIQVRGPREPDKGPVLLVHGAGVRANIFRPPLERNFVDCLVDEGYDVWLENWRASIDLPSCEWTLDEAAVHDHPAAVRKVLDETGARSLKAVIHCQGSTSFTMAAVAGLLPEVTTIVSNAVSLHPRVCWISRQKSRFAVPLLSRFTRYLNPQWGESASGFVPRLLQAIVKLTHHECDNGVCRFASFTYGTGFPVLWRHENLDEAVHDWIRGEFGNVPLSFFRQMARCLETGHLIGHREPGHGGLPVFGADLTDFPPRTDARFAFIAGELNACFDWHSQQASFDWFDRHRPDFHSLRVLGGYGHLDVFLGKHAERDVYPVLLDELARPEDCESPLRANGQAIAAAPRHAEPVQ